jgi:leucyl/phenylalanyl-tRNA--protein transferase
MDDLVGVSRGLDPEVVLEAYARGVFPMGSERRRVVSWHCPDPRAVLPLDGFHASRSLQRSRRRGGFTFSFDRAFTDVMLGCAAFRPVWITPEFVRVYSGLNARGRAHSVEVWQHGVLVGGLYGVHLGAAFFAESKFHRVTDASKLALWALVERLNERGFRLLEVQYVTPHLATLGAVEIPLAEYLRRLAAALAVEATF